MTKEFEEEMKQFVKDAKASPHFGHLFNRIHVANHMHIFSEREDHFHTDGRNIVGIEWRPIFLDERDKTPGARFMNRGKNAWRIFANPLKTGKDLKGETPDARFYYHFKGCRCCSYESWTPKQQGNPYCNRNRYAPGTSWTIIRREY